LPVAVRASSPREEELLVPPKCPSPRKRFDVASLAGLSGIDVVVWEVSVVVAIRPLPVAVRASSPHKEEQSFRELLVPPKCPSPRKKLDAASLAGLSGIDFVVVWEVSVPVAILPLPVAVRASSPREEEPSPRELLVPPKCPSPRKRLDAASLAGLSGIDVVVLEVSVLVAIRPLPVAVRASNPHKEEHSFRELLVLPKTPSLSLNLVPYQSLAAKPF
jgi:hypothetical protein